MTDSTFKVGDRVTYGSSEVVWTVAALWTEKFEAFDQPQWVAKLTGPGNDFNMRAAHLIAAPQPAN